MAAATATVVADLLLPTLVLLALAALSLAVRQRGPRSLGVRRPQHGWLLAGKMLAFGVLWTALSVVLLIPLANRITGQRQDVSAFADLQGNLTLMVLLIVASWTLAAVGEEVGYRGYVLTRLTEMLGNRGGAVVLAALLSSILFGLAHTEQGPVGVLLSAVDGLAFAFLRFRYSTVWAPVLAHGFINTLGFVTFFFVGPVYGIW